MIDKKKARNAYRNQTGHCLTRKDRHGNSIEMRLTFEEWCDIWERSGKWGERGRGANEYCMCRHNDLGHYEVGNVSIKTNLENNREIQRVWTTESRQKITSANIRRNSVKPMLDANRGRPLSEDHKLAISLGTMGRNSPFKGKQHSEAARDKLRVAMTGKTLPQSTCDKIGQAFEGRKWFNDGSKNYRLYEDDVRSGSLRPGRLPFRSGQRTRA